MSWVFLYPGQGSQKAGMGADFYEEFPEYRLFLDALPAPFDLKGMMHEGTEEQLARTEYTQPCMAAIAAGITHLLAGACVVPAAAAGLSLGEYCALYAGGCFTPDELLTVTSFRGRAMAEAAEGLSCCMSAVIGPDSGAVDAACRQASRPDTGFVAAANYNCPGQTVICGDERAVEEAEAILKAQKAVRTVRLKVSGPFHTPFMKPAAEKLEGLFRSLGPFVPAEPKIPVTANATGGFYPVAGAIGENGAAGGAAVLAGAAGTAVDSVDAGKAAALAGTAGKPGAAAEISGLLTRQVQESVRLEQNLRALLTAGYRDFLEIGPGNTMRGFLKKTARAMGIPVRAEGIGTAAEFRDFLQRGNGIPVPAEGQEA